MKLPEPVGTVQSIDAFSLVGVAMPVMPPVGTNLYSETQLRAEIEKRDAVLRMALDTIESIAVDRGLRMTAVEEEIRRVLD